MPRTGQGDECVIERNKWNNPQTKYSRIQATGGRRGCKRAVGAGQDIPGEGSIRVSEAPPDIRAAVLNEHYAAILTDVAYESESHCTLFNAIHQ